MFNLKHRKTLACTLCLIGSLACANKQSKEIVNHIGPTPSQVESTVSEWKHAASIPGVSIAYIRDSRIKWVLEKGKANREDDVTADTLFNIASLTKPMFSMMSLQLMEKDKLSLDEPLSQHWVDPDVKDDQRHQLLTPRLALSHQTGFTNWRGKRPLSFMFNPGQRYEYSGEGFEYLKRYIEHKLDTKMPELMEQYVTRPLAMNKTYFGWQEKLGHKIAARYDEQGNMITHKQFYRASYSAACCTLSTLEDYAKFVQWVSQGAELSEVLLSQLQTEQAVHDEPAEYFGLGWRLVKTPASTFLMHDGREPGVRTFVTLSPQTGEGLIIFTNSSNGELLYRPVIKSSLTNGKAYLSRTDKDTWQYLTSIEKEMQPRMISFIAQSPSFVSKALHAANETVFNQANLKLDPDTLSALKQKSSSLVDQFVLMMLSNRTEAERQKLRQHFTDLMLYLSSDNGQLVLKEKLKASVTIKGWIARLETAINIAP